MKLLDQPKKNLYKFNCYLRGSLGCLIPVVQTILMLSAKTICQGLLSTTWLTLIEFGKRLIVFCPPFFKNG